MNFVDHSRLRGQHAYLSASKYHWVRYSDEKLKETYHNQLAKERGTRLHALAEECIKLGQKLPRTSKTINMFVNDAIGYRMESEQVLYYSENCFGTADAISFRNNLLRIHDLKTGATPAHMEQLMIYAALFCLEYDKKPGEIKMELRIYQSDEVNCFTPTAEDILPIMDKIITFDKILEQLKMEESEH